MTTRDFLGRLGRPFAGLIGAGLGLAVLAALSNWLLLAVAGWFLAATAVAGLGSAAVQASFNIVLPAACVRLLAMTRILARYGERLVTHDLALRQSGLVQSWLFGRIARIGSVRMAAYRGGDLLHRCVSDSDAIGRGWLDVVMPLAVACVMAIAGLAAASAFDARCALLLAVALLGMGVVWPVCLLRRQSGDTERLEALRIEDQAALVALLDGFETLLIERGGEALAAEITGRAAQAQGCADRIAGRQTLHGTMVVCVAALTAMGVALLGSATFHAGAGTGAAFLPMLALGALAVFDPLIPVGASCAALVRLRLAVARLSGMETPAATPETDRAIAVPETIALDHVTVRHAEQGDAVLSGASFVLRREEPTVLTGPSGSGKSTVLATLMGQIVPDQGAVLLDGHDAAGCDTRARASVVAAVPQRTHLFHDTLRANMRLAVPEAEDDAIWEALHAAQLGPLVRSWPEGLDTLLGAAGPGEAGVRLSGGESRRLAVAQALLRRKPWLVLDEATVGLDADTERRVLDALDTLPWHPGIFHLAHRSAVQARAFHVLRLENGSIAPVRPP
ncbi:amino acid ABC transporter ATP-binding/permease protein [Acidomonas methanolica]|uniref:ABC transporter cysteine exporter CydCD n=1 Tax=Acidomonas methanolica NBRC 104435 TaxID=1231351 RepID=A0A023D3B2_ACIMT|nr:ATP-binding cassette domain-containing protein [Acidomonas methanolica]MBU2653536.1 ATP-binding cassette domain-containing protein [Acidomonas methanolica]TCS31486.1 ATP-binding cassette subfamily C protein CydC [Acidomonas methanolica]GAJ28291.1 ABC transporter cysteine exporter CydCD [Acidomonas methanolica NBRC 104435]GBQ55375.1 cysteine ABC transporter permease CydC [Acidomonas methanolica]GEK97906.1 thiol reductant ABC exporter subunit CydC [Acidomonas methanolica NBRC 104435]